MNKIKNFIKTSLIGGVIIVLPIAILVFIFKKLFDIVTNLVQPMTNFILKFFSLPEIVADIIVITIIMVVCFIVGLVIKTRIGIFIHKNLEERVLKIAPGYKTIKETVLQFIGKDKTAFSRVALAKIFENDTLVTTFVTDEHEDGSYTVFMPTGPNPTSGNIYHLKNEYVFPIDVDVEETLRSIISCGAGSTKIIDAYRKKYKV